MKTPEEIKKGLACCFADEHDCKNCAYAEMVKDEEFGETFYYHCGEIDKDAIAYIQQLEDAIDKTTQLMQSATEVIKKSQEQLESTYSQVKKTLCGNENVSWVEVLEAADQLKSRLAQVERERDAAVNDLREASFCGDCFHYAVYAEKEPCASCLQRGFEKPNWEWRGV